MKVVILGGGIAGLSAAHMLCSSDQDMEIHIYESDDIIGGQASSRMGKTCYIEYCWRVFFSTYTNIKSIIQELNAEKNFEVLKYKLFDKKKVEELELSKFLFEKMKEGNWELVNNIIKLGCECKPRLIQEYDDISADDFFKKDIFVRTFLGPYLGFDTTKVSLSSFLKFMFSMYDNRKENNETGGSKVSTMPTQQALFEPWQRFLENKGVHIHLSSNLTEIIYSDEIVKHVVVSGEKVTADEYIFACPIKTMNRLLKPTCETFAKMRHLESGLQLYYSLNLNLSKPLKPDAVNQFVLMDTPWYLVVDKKRAWKGKTLANCKPNVKESWNIAAVDGIKGSLYDKVLSDCSKQEAQEEILYQLQQSEYLKKEKMEIIDIEDWPQFENDINGKLTVTNPKFSVNVGNLKFMPATSHPDDIPKNMHLAAYYVNTTMGGVSMESSCETGLQAGQHLLDSKHMSHKRSVLEHNDNILSYFTLPLILLDYVLYHFNIAPLTAVVPPILLFVVLLLLYGWIVFRMIWYFKR
jgi:uncharacterized protein with NAD-binding domain and iron-sulfur cluster